MIPSSIPVELCLPIFLFADDQKDLCTLCAVSHTVQREAERVLYHTVQLQCEPATLLWSRTITETPRLAKLVCSLTLSAAVHLDKCNILVAAFGAIINLKKLVILNLSGEWSSRSHFNPASLKGCTFRLNVYHNRLDVPWDEYVKFLSEQPDIRKWVAPHFKEDIDEIRSPKVLPRLTDATLYDSNILKVISSRTLRCLTLRLPPLVAIWNNTEEFLGDIIRAIRPFGQCLTHLNMGACSPLPCPWATEVFISHVAAHLPSLKFLRYAANRVSHYFRHRTRIHP
jgi:hypothetical protein